MINCVLLCELFFLFCVVFELNTCVISKCVGFDVDNKSNCSEEAEVMQFGDINKQLECITISVVCGLLSTS